MKFVFLDIDGVANSSRSVVVKLGPTIQTSEQVRVLARLDEADFYNGLAGNQDMLNDEGLEYGVKFGLMTVDPVCVALINKLFEADPEIGLVLSSTHRKWLNHAYEEGLFDDGDPYVILDDAADMLPGQPLVLIDPTRGFSFNDYAEACKHLGLKEPGLVLL